MTQSEWQAERARLASELSQADADWTGFRAHGDWDGARVAQTKFYELRDALAMHDTRAPDQVADGQSGHDLTFAEWQAEADRISGEIDIVDAEWKILRDKGKWDVALISQERYHFLRKQLAALASRKPKQ